MPSVIQLYTDRAWHHQHCSLVCSAQESERQIITAVFHSEQSCIGECGMVDVLVGEWVFWLVYSNVRCLCCVYSLLSLFLVKKYDECSQRMDQDQILSCQDDSPSGDVHIQHTVFVMLCCSDSLLYVQKSFKENVKYSLYIIYGIYTDYMCAYIYIYILYK